MRRTLRIIFPFGIFLLFFLLTGVGSAFLSGYYLYSDLKAEIREVSEENEAIASTLVEAVADIAELSSDKEVSRRLNSFFRKELSNKNVYSAFYTLEDGTILAHSSEEEVKKLDGNIAADEFSYNLDQIYYPIRYKKSGVYLSDYYIMDEDIPFNKQELVYLKKYFDENIDRNGWIAVKTVEKKVKTGRRKYSLKEVGTVAIIISKKNIYSLINTQKEYALNFLIKVLIGCGVLSFFVSLIIHIRYISISNKTLKMQTPVSPGTYSFEKANDEMPPRALIEEETDTQEEYPEIFAADTGERLIPDPAKILHKTQYRDVDGNKQEPDKYYNRNSKFSMIYEESPEKPSPSAEIKDAIPVNKKVV